MNLGFDDDRKRWCSNFGHRLRAAMHDGRLRQKDLAEKADLPKSTISHYATGRHGPSAYAAWKLARALDMSMDELCGRWDE